MSRFTGILLGTLMVLALGAITAANAAVTYDPILEWTGPYFRVIGNPAIDQLVDDPVIDIPFVQPMAVAAREHDAANARDVVYVVDSGHNRVQAFEVNGSFYNDNGFTMNAAVPPVAAAPNEYDDNEIWLSEYVATTAGVDNYPFVLPGSESVIIDGVEWHYVADLTGSTAANQVYSIDYDAVPGPKITFPASSLTSTSNISLSYALTNYKGTLAADHTYGTGDVDYGVDNAGTRVLAEIDEAVTNGPQSWQNVHSIAQIANEAAASSDDIFLVDCADNSANQNEELFYYRVTTAGAVTYCEAYDDVLTTPYDVAVANWSGPTEVAANAVESGAGDIVTAVSVRDASQVTGHVYSVVLSGLGGTLTVTDVTTGKVLVSAAANADIAAAFLAIPGVSLTVDPAAAANFTSTITTTRAVTDRFLFVADTGGDRIKVISSGDANPTATNDWLPGDAHTMTAQPTGAPTVGGTADVDYRYTTAANVTEDYSVNTLAFPIKEGTLETIAMDPAGDNDTWTRIDDLVTAGPTDLVYTVEWQTGKITFGDGVHGAMPDNSTAFDFTYTTTPDVMRYGTSGTGPGQFSGPRGIAARWNSQMSRYDVYVADTGNNRIQKLAFTPADAALNLPARMDFICEWNTASTAVDVLNNPVDIAVMMDRAGSAGDIFLAVADQGNDRLLTYNDNSQGSNIDPPTWDALGGSQGNSLGLYMQIEGVAFIANGQDLDIYACDAVRGTVTKYEESPTPTITLTFTGGSLLPACFPPSSSYTFSFTTVNPPAGGWIDFYYDTSDTYDATTAKLCIATQTVEASATSATWNFADTPDGVPADNVGYYLFAQVKDANGTVVATDQTTSAELFCMDSSLLPGVRGTDRVDGDWTLYLQNGLDRVIDLQVAFPDSITGVGFGGTYPFANLDVTGIVPGNGWDATNYINLIFNQTYNNDTGTYLVNTSVTGSPVGLVTAGPHTLAEMAVRSKDNVLSATQRFLNGTVALVAANSGMVDINGSSPAQWVTRNVNLRWGYLGDVASAGGADSTLPNLVVKPDGKINFDDQMVFTLGWNGSGNVQDPISDIGPTEGSLPDLRPLPDGKWNVDDLLAFTLMYSWASGQGYYKNASDLVRTDEPRPAALGLPMTGTAVVRSVSAVDVPKVGECIAVDLNVDGVRDLAGALINVGYDPARLELLSIENGRFLDGKSGSLFFQKAGQGWIEIAASRLDQAQPGVSGHGTVARATFRILDENAGDLDLQYDLRSASGAVLSRGASQAGAYTGTATGFQLYAAHPNPMQSSTNIVYSVPSATDLSLDVYDVTGRHVRALFNGRRDAGYHVAQFDGRDDAGSSLAGGVYFYRLQADGRTVTQKLTLSR